MPIIAEQQDADGGLWGFDDEAGEWVPLDIESEQGSFLGNVGRSAVRGARQIGQGAAELIGPESERETLQGEILQQQSTAAARSAPWASAIGEAVPDVAAGVGVGLASGGLGLVPALALEAGAGAALGAIRPGSAEERVQRSLYGAGFGLAGGALGPVAAKGIGAGLAMGKTITDITIGRVGRVVETSGARLAMAEREAALAARRSVGAAEVPEEELPETFLQERQVLERTEDVGAEVPAGGYQEQMRRRAEELGYRSPLGAGTRAMSPARLLAAGRELTPLGEISEQTIKAQNQGLIANKLAQAMGLRNAEGKTTIDLPDLADAEAEIGARFEQVQTQLPEINAAAVAEAFKRVSQTQGPVGKMQGQKLIQSAIDNAEAHGGAYTPEEIMQTRQALSAEMADFYARGRTADGEAVMQALNRLDDVIERATMRAGRQDVVETWQRARKQWQISTMASKGAAVSATGDVNVKTLLNQMKKPKSSGGFGKDGPERGTPERELWDLLTVAAADETGVPMTGARLAMRLAGRNPALQAGVLGTGAIGAASTLWD